MSVDKDDKVTLTCKASFEYSGSPYWFTNDKEIMNTTRIHITRTISPMENTTYLTISKAQINDSGTYLCMAPKKRKGERMVDIKLNVFGKISFFPVLYCFDIIFPNIAFRSFL